MARCHTNVDGTKVCHTQSSSTGMYCKGCRERMVADGTWTEAHAKRQSDLRARHTEMKRVTHAHWSEEEKAAFRARERARSRNYHARDPDARKAADTQRYKNIKLDPVKWEARKQQWTVYNRKRTLKRQAEREKKRKRTLTDVNDNDDGDGDESDAPPALAQIVIPGDNVVVISDGEGEDAGSGADTSGSSVEGIEFVYSDEEDDGE